MFYILCSFKLISNTFYIVFVFNLKGVVVYSDLVLSSVSQ